jgi:hypothetical protein
MRTVTLDTTMERWLVRSGWTGGEAGRLGGSWTGRQGFMQAARVNTKVGRTTSDEVLRPRALPRSLRVDRNFLGPGPLQCGVAVLFAALTLAVTLAGGRSRMGQEAGEVGLGWVRVKFQRDLDVTQRYLRWWAAWQRFSARLEYWKSLG